MAKQNVACRRNIKVRIKSKLFVVSHRKKKQKKKTKNVEKHLTFIFYAGKFGAQS